MKKSYSAPEFNTIPFPLEPIMDANTTLFVSGDGGIREDEDGIED